MSKSPSLRRIQADIRELALDPSDRYHAAPLEHDMFEWHFTIRGADDTDFAGGVYHGRILLPPDYPFKPPHILFLTPSGRFETHTKICLSFSAFHPELWQPAWGIRLILEALISFLPTPADGALGSLDWSGAERRTLAKQSVEFVCGTCCGGPRNGTNGNNSSGAVCKVVDLLPPLRTTKEKDDGDDDNDDASSKPAAPKVLTRFQKEIAELQRLQMLEHQKKDDGGGDATTASKNDVTKEPAAATAATPAARTTTITDAPSSAAAAASTTPVAASSPVAPKLDGSAETTTMTTAASEPRPVAPAPAALPPPPVIDPVLQQVQQQQRPLQLQPDDLLTSKWLDPVLQCMIIVLSILCVMLLRKVQNLLADLAELEES